MSIAVAASLAMVATLSPTPTTAPTPLGSGLPTLTEVGDSVLGGTLDLVIGNTIFSPTEFIFFGTAGLLPSPLQVGSYGFLHVLPPLTIVPANPDHTVSLPVPLAPALIGANVYFQAFGLVLNGPTGESKLSDPITVTLLSPAPEGLSYPDDPVTYIEGDPIADNVPTVTWEPDDYSVDPPLPLGLSIDAGTGVISGTPLEVTATDDYVVTASNSQGSTQAVLTITVDPAAPAAFDYTQNPAVYTAGTPIADNEPIITGFVDSYSVDKALPDGLTLDPATGVISGTPTALTPNDTYTVTASNITGSVDVLLDIEVLPAAPTGLAYEPALLLFADLLPITPVTPTVDAEVVDSFSISPPLPAGLSFDTATGTISGAPVSTSALNSYLVTATNVSGSDDTIVEIVVDNLPSPILSGPATGGPGEDLVYTASAAPGHSLLDGVTPILAYDVAITDPVYTPGLGVSYLDVNSPTYAEINGDGTFTWSVAVPNDTGLVGTRYYAQATAFVFDLLNFSGSVRLSNVTETLITLPAPTSVDYGVEEVTYLVGDAIDPLVPTVVGFADTFAVSPPLPAGLALDTSTGEISGTPTVALGSATYTVTASNPSGSTQDSFDVRVIDGLFPQFAFVTNQLHDTVSVFALDAETGQPRHQAYEITGAAPAAPAGVVATSDGSYVYVANAFSSTIVGYSFDASIGQLTEIEVETIVGGAFPSVLAIDESDSYLYCAVGGGTDGVYGFAINGNGTLAPLGGSPYGNGSRPNDIAIRGDVLVTCSANGVDTVDSYTIDPGTGDLLAVSTLVAGASPRGLDMTADGAFVYVANNGSDDVSAYSATPGGVLTELASSPFDVLGVGGEGPEDVSVSRKGFLYTANLDNGTVSAFAIAPSGALVSLGASTSVGTGTRAVQVDPSGSFLYVMNEDDDEIDVFDITGAGSIVPAFPVSTVRTMTFPGTMHVLGGLYPARPYSDRGYAVAESANQVFEYLVDTGTGALSQIGTPTPTLNLPVGVTMHPDQDYAFVTNLGAQGVGRYEVLANGSLFGVPPAAITDPAPWNTIFEPSGRYAYASLANGTGGVQKLTFVDGSDPLTVGGTAAAGAQTRRGALHPSGRFLYVPNQGADSVSQFAVDPQTGDLSPLVPASVAAGAGPRDVKVDPSGRFAYAANADGTSMSMYSVGAAGALTSLGAAAISGSGPAVLAIEPSGRFLYLGYTGSASVSIYTINGTTGVATELGGGLSPVALTDEIGDLHVDASGEFLLVTQRGSADSITPLAIDPTTGALSAGTPIFAGNNPREIETNVRFDLASE